MTSKMFRVIVVTLCLGVFCVISQETNTNESCQTVNREVGSCVSVLECAPYRRILEFARSNATATQLLKQAHCGFNGSIPKVCCPRVSTTNTTTTPPANGSGVRRGGGDFVETLPEPPVCGISNGTFGKVVGGENAQLGDFPWMAALGYRFRQRAIPLWMCGGALITNKHVLTAGHCISTHEEDLYLVRLGELDLERDDDGATPIDVGIKTKLVHEEYNPNNYDNDIGLLVLEKQVTFTDLIQPICLPKNEKERSLTFENYNPFVAGWGLTGVDRPSAPHLQLAQVPVARTEQCARAYAQNPGRVGRVGRATICAGDAHRDACMGDGGGPLMLTLPDNNKLAFYQIGVVAYGKRCGEPGFPGIYTRVTYFMPWIEEKLLGATIETLS